MALLSLFLCFLLIPGVYTSGESLWSPGFKGYAVDNGAYAPGSIILVRVDAATDLSLKSMQSREDTASFTVSGGSIGEILSFVPSGDAQANREVEDKQTLSLETHFAVRIAGVDDDGNLLLAGRRQITLGGLVEEIYLEGSADPGSIQNGTVRFTDLADALLRYRSNAEPSGQLIREDELSREETPATVEAPVAEEPGDAQGNPETPQAGEEGSLQLDRQRQDELLRRYINRFLQILFDQGDTSSTDIP